MRLGNECVDKEEWFQKGWGLAGTPLFDTSKPEDSQCHKQLKAASYNPRCWETSNK